MSTKIRDELLSIILSAFDIPINDIEINSDDVSIITTIADRHRIIPIISVGIKNIGYAELLTDKLIKGEAKAVYDYTQRNVSIDEIANEFEKAEIAYIPLKGSVIRDLYPQPWMRTSNDIDILIHAEDIEKAVQVLESNTSFKLLKRARHDVHFVNEYVHLELHFSFDYAVKQINCALSTPWEHVISVPDSFKYSFTPEYNMFYIVSHTAKHFIQNGGVGIRPILDIYLIKKHTDIDENKLKLLCKDAGVLGFYDQCCKLINVWFNGDFHDEISQSFEDIVFFGGVFGSKHLKIVSNKRKDSGKKYIGRRIFKTSEEIKAYYPQCRKHPILVPYYQVVRWKRILISKKTNEYVSEFKYANSINQSEVEKYDKLMKAMGL